jgi:hypothetical protein
MLMSNLIGELERRNGRYGLLTMCESGGTANATIVERVDGPRVPRSLMMAATPAANGPSGAMRGMAVGYTISPHMTSAHA